MPFRYWAVFPQISRTDWGSRWGDDGFMPRELLFCDDLYASSFPGQFASAAGGARLRWLIGEQQVRPEDILVLCAYRDRARRLADAVREASIAEIHLATQEKDQRIGRRGRPTVSTVASAKGYDAYCVLLASANEFKNDVHGRASFYVGCTRAIEYLELFGYARSGLLVEAERTIERLGPPVQ